MFHKFLKIKTLGDLENEGILTISGEIVIQEKYDGGQVGFYIENDILHFTSHNQDLTNSNQIKETGLPKNWKFIEPVLKIWKEYPERFNEDLYYYGETTQRHTLQYPDDTPGFIGYDILNLYDGELLDWRFTEIEFRKVGLPFIHVYYYGEATELSKGYFDNTFNSVYRDGKAEGVVIKRYDVKSKYNRPLFAKVVDDEFKEKNRIAFGGEKPPRKLNNGDKIAEIYATDARIEKMIHKMHDEGYDIRMDLMRFLFGRVVEDILEEEIISIRKEFDSINFKELNKAVSKRCPKVLKKVMINENK